MARRIAPIIVAIVIFGAVLGALYYFLGQRQTAPATTPTSTTGGLPALAPSQGSFKQIAQFTLSGQTNGTSSAGLPLSDRFGVVSLSPADSFFVDAQSNVLIVQRDGQIIQASNGQSTVLSSAIVNNFLSSSFSADGKKVLVTFGDPHSPQASLFDIDAKEWTSLPQHLIGPVWSPSGYTVAYLSPTTAGNDIITLDLGAKAPQPKTLVSLSLQDVVLSWSIPQQIIINDRPSGLVASAAWVFDMKDRELLPYLPQTPGLETIWDASGTYMLSFAAAADQRGGSLQLLDRGSGAVSAPGFVTLPSKCAFGAMTSTSTSAAASSTAPSTTPTLVCGVPRDQDFGQALLPDAYEQRSLYSDDGFVMFDPVARSQKAAYDDPDIHVDATDLKIANNKVFFINRYDDRVYGFTLP